MVDIAAFHEQQLGAAFFPGYGVTVGMLTFVTVYAFEFYRHTVDEEASVLQFHLTESDESRNCFRNTTVGILQIHY